MRPPLKSGRQIGFAFARWFTFSPCRESSLAHRDPASPRQPRPQKSRKQEYQIDTEGRGGQLDRLLTGIMTITSRSGKAFGLKGRSRIRKCSVVTMAYSGGGTAGTIQICDLWLADRWGGSGMSGLEAAGRPSWADREVEIPICLRRHYPRFASGFGHCGRQSRGIGVSGNWGAV